MVWRDCLFLCDEIHNVVFGLKCETKPKMYDHVVKCNGTCNLTKKESYHLWLSFEVGPRPIWFFLGFIDIKYIYTIYNFFWKICCPSTYCITFFLENLLPQHVLCYHAQLLDRWAGLLTEEVQIHPDMTQAKR